MISFVKDFPFQYGEPDQLSPLITRIIAHNPGPFTFTGSGAYLIGNQKGVAVIDPGPDLKTHQEALVRHSPGPITDILITHTHKDHCGGADTLKSLTGARTHGMGPHPSPPENAPPAFEEGADFSFTPDHVLTDGDEVSGPGWTLTALHTPGHISNHLCFSLEEENSLFTGDHIMGWATTVVAPPDGNMTDYYASLDLLLARQDQRYYPTHGAPIERPQDYVAAIKAHRDQRDRSILAALSSVPKSIIEITKEVYTDIDPALHVAASFNVRAHLERHLGLGTVAQVNENYILTPPAQHQP